MQVVRTAPRASGIEVLDRVLDKGIVIDAQARVSLAGVHLIDIDVRVIVASIETYLAYSDELAAVPAQAPVRAADPAPDSPLTPPRMAGDGQRKRIRKEGTRPRRRTARQLQCAQGCTFTGAQTRERVRCPYRPDAMCAVGPR